MASKVYYAGTHRYSFRPHEYAEIVGIEWVVPEGQQGRACFLVRYADGVEDLSPIEDIASYRLASSHDMLLSTKLPPTE